METAITREEAGRICPVCGYDRRGATGPRCTECGTVVGIGVRSRIPWVGWRHIGRVRAYVRTCWMVARRPGKLAEEARWRVSRRGGRSFCRVSAVLAAVVGTGLFAVAFLFRGDWWAGLGPPYRSGFFDSPLASILGDWSTPAYVFWDSWFILIPVAMSLLIGFGLSASILRFVLGIGEGNRFARRRQRRAGFYFSAIFVWEAAILGLLGIAEMILSEQPKWLGDGWLDGTLVVARWILPVLAAVVLLWPMVFFLLKSMRERPARFEIRLFLLGLSAALFLPWEGPSIASGDAVREFGGSWWDGVTELVLPVLGAAFGLGAIMGICLLVFSKKRAKVARVWTALVAYPLAMLVIWPVVFAGVFWVCGYLAIGIGSMLGR